MTRNAESVWDLGALPFLIGVHEAPTNDPFPDSMPFVVGIERDTGVLVQMPNVHVSEALSVVYEQGSQIGTPLADCGLGQDYLVDFFEFIAEVLAERLDEVRVLEIGCGAGALLQHLAQRAVSAMGIEPSRSAAADARRKGLDVIQGLFNASVFDRRFDLIVHHAVLEHIENGVSFLREQLELLDPEGMIILSVPDCREAFTRGDLSPLIHEHWSYFTPRSLTSTAAAAGAQVVCLRPAGVGGAIHAVLKRAPHTAERCSDEGAAQAFASLAETGIRRLATFATQIADHHGELGVYPGGRFINYQALLGHCLPPRTRYFDDDPRLEGRYYPTIATPIESRAALLAEPVDELLITSWSFGTALAGELRKVDALRRTNIRTIGEVLEPPSTVDEESRPPLFDK